MKRLGVAALALGMAGCIPQFTADDIQFYPAVGDVPSSMACPEQLSLFAQNFLSWDWLRHSVHLWVHDISGGPLPAGGWHLNAGGVLNIQNGGATFTFDASTLTESIETDCRADGTYVARKWNWDAFAFNVFNTDETLWIHQPGGSEPSSIGIYATTGCYIEWGNVPMSCDVAYQHPELCVIPGPTAQQVLRHDPEPRCTR